MRAAVLDLKRRNRGMSTHNIEVGTTIYDCPAESASCALRRVRVVTEAGEQEGRSASSRPE